MAAFPDRKDYPELSALLALEGAHKFDLQAKKALMDELDQRDIRVPPGFLVYWYINGARKRPYCTFYNHLAGRGCNKEQQCNMVHRCLVCNGQHGMWFRDSNGASVCPRVAKLQSETEQLGERATVIMDAWRTARVSPETDSRRTARVSPAAVSKPPVAGPVAAKETPGRLLSRPSPIGRPTSTSKADPTPPTPAPKPAAAAPTPTPPKPAATAPTPTPPKPAAAPTAILPRPVQHPPMPTLTLLPPPMMVVAPPRSQPQLMMVEVPTAAFLDFISGYRPEYFRAGSGAASADSKTLISAISYV